MAYRTTDGGQILDTHDTRADAKPVNKIDHLDAETKARIQRVAELAITHMPEKKFGDSAAQMGERARAREAEYQRVITREIDREIAHQQAVRGDVESDSDTRFKNVSSTGSTFMDEIRAATGAYDVPAEVLARMHLAARTAAAFIVDPAERAAMIRKRLVGDLQKLKEIAQ